MPGLEERLRDLPLEAPSGLGDRARHAAEDGPGPRDRGPWIQTVGAIVVVAMVVILTITAVAHPDPRVFANISAGLGS